jgi:hypothetical protein
MLKLKELLTKERKKTKRLEAEKDSILESLNVARGLHIENMQSASNRDQQILETKKALEELSKERHKLILVLRDFRRKESGRPIGAIKYSMYVRNGTVIPFNDSHLNNLEYIPYYPSTWWSVKRVAKNLFRVKR